MRDGESPCTTAVFPGDTGVRHAVWRSLSTAVSRVILEYATPSGEVYRRQFSRVTLEYATPSGEVYRQQFSRVTLEYATPSGEVYRRQFSRVRLEYATPSGEVYRQQFSRVTLEYATPSGEVSPRLLKKKTGCLTTTLVCVCKPPFVSDCQRLQCSGYFFERESDGALKGKLELISSVVFVFVARRPRVCSLAVGTVCWQLAQFVGSWHSLSCPM